MVADRTPRDVMEPFEFVDRYGVQQTRAHPKMFILGNIREVAIQTWQVTSRITQGKGLRVEIAYGGENTERKQAEAATS